MREEQQHTGITSVTIENFKAIRNEQTVVFRPITLLFGPNSAGKSTILQALQFMREILERSNVNADRTAVGGDSVDLGGFLNLAAHHDPEHPVSVRVDFDLGGDELPMYGHLSVNESEDTDLRKDLFENGFSEVETAWVKVKAEWDKDSHRAWATEYEVGLNGNRIAEIWAAPELSPLITFVDFEHPLFMRFDDEEGVGSEEDQGTRLQLKDLFKDLSAIADSSSPVIGVEIVATEDDDVIPDFSCPLELSGSNAMEGDRRILELFTFLINQVLVGTGQLLLTRLKGMRYLGPIRSIPSRNFAPQSSPAEVRWADGLAAWDVLYSHYDHDDQCGDNFFKGVSRLMSQEDELDLGYSMALAEVYEVRDGSAIMSHLRMLESGSEADAGELFRGPLIGELKRLRPHRRLLLHDDVNDTKVKPQDIGVGISQVLPVLVGAVEPRCTIFAVEQPELHIHPRIQCSLGDVFAGEVGKSDDRLFLIETHSEHLILRLLRRIRETTDGELPPGKPKLAPDDVAVYYVEGGESGMKVTELPVTPDGDFLRDWPGKHGFFEEREEELF